MKFVAVVTRTLREGKTYDDYRRAWFHSNGFGVPTQMYTVVNAFNPREIISIGIIDTEVDQLSGLLAIDVEDRLANPLDEVIEEAIVRTFGVVAAVDDFSAAGALDYVEPSVDGVAADPAELPDTLAAIAAMVSQASDDRDRAKPSARE
ncbi:MAG: hypothetical protein QG671_3005 [Actinomycetota bacterium]|jgi:hypothetical protein|nr:hypothetical protein [Actinomycetota bacterium]HQZ85877.1 ROK family protein [Actinomycetota bacterium]